MCRVTICCEGPRDILTVLNWFLDNNSAQFSVPVIKIKNKFGQERPRSHVAVTDAGRGDERKCAGLTKAVLGIQGWRTRTTMMDTAT
eukprot:2409535-Rhodomonas_salina.2